MRKAVLLFCLWTVILVPTSLWAEDAPVSEPEIGIEIEDLFSPAQAEPLLLIVPPSPYCWDVEGTTCTTLGATRSCTDVCQNKLSCTCRLYYYPNGTVKRLWDCQEVC